MELLRLADVADFINGKAFKPEDWKTSGIPIIRIQNLTGTSDVFNYFDGEIENKYLVSQGDILISWSASLGIYEWQCNGVLNQHIFKVNLKKGVEKKYFYYAVMTRIREMENQVHGSTMKHITKDKFDNIEIPLPDLTTQKRIAQLLHEADIARQKRKAANALTDQFLQSTFLSIFGNPLINEKGWQPKLLSDVVNSIDSGWSPVCDDSDRTSDDEWAVLKLSAVTYGKFDPTQNKRLPLDLVSKRLDSIEVKKSDLLFTRKNTKELIAATAFVFDCPKRLLMSDTIFRINYKPEELSGIYLWYLFSEKNFRSQLQSLASGSSGSMPNISKDKLMKVKLPVPPLSIQQKFASIVTDTEQLRQKQKQSEIELENLFQALLQKYFG